MEYKKQTDIDDRGEYNSPVFNYPSSSTPFNPDVIPVVYPPTDSDPRMEGVEMRTMNEQRRPSQNVWSHNYTEHFNIQNEPVKVHCMKCENLLIMPVGFGDINKLGNIDIKCPYCGNEFVFGMQNRIEDKCVCVPIPIPFPLACTIL